MDSQDDRFEGNDAGYDSTATNLSHKGVVALAAIVFFSTVVLFLLGMHIYACVVSNRRRRLAFVGEQDSPRLQRVGLARSAIEAIPVIVYQSENQRDMIECAVCLCEFEENEKARLLPKCQHSFHIDCIDMWLHSHSTCPLCRTSAQPDKPDTPADSVVLLAADEEPASGSASETDRRMLHPPISEGSASTSMDTDHDIDLRPSCRQHEVLPSLKYPSNMHFWATQKRVSSVSNSTFYDQRATSSSCKTLDKIIIDIPQRDDSFSSPRRPFFSDDQQVFSPSGQSLKSPGMRLRSLKRLLSKDKKVLQQSPDGGRNIPIELGIHHKTEDS